jgi:hypothetical protein
MSQNDPKMPIPGLEATEIEKNLHYSTIFLTNFHFLIFQNRRFFFSE